MTRALARALDEADAPAHRSAFVRIGALADMRRLAEAEEQAAKRERDELREALSREQLQNVREALTRPPSRHRLDDERKSVTRKLTVQTPDGPVRMYATVGLFLDGTPGELFLKVDRQGSTLSGFADAVAVAVSLGLQHGVPLAAYVAKFRHARFEPSGMTGDADYPMASSLLDALAAWMERRFLTTGG